MKYEIWCSPWIQECVNKQTQHSNLGQHVLDLVLEITDFVFPKVCFFFHILIGVENLKFDTLLMLNFKNSFSSTVKFQIFNFFDAFFCKIFLSRDKIKANVKTISLNNFS